MNGSRPVISYEDITLPYSSTEADASPPNAPVSVSKKQKANNTKAKKRQNRRQKPNQATNNYVHTHEEYSCAEEEEEDYEESRELTHQEIWDDSALIDAWNAASEEYEAFNGPDKGWKSEPVHKSPLWYNIPPEKVTNLPPQKKRKIDAEEVPAARESHEDMEVEGDSKPINFDTFVPTHDPSLQPSAGGTLPSGTSTNLYEMAQIPGITTATPSAASHLQELLSNGAMVSRDEAFSRALGAMYWGGYWTAMYHCQGYLANQTQQSQTQGAEEQADDQSGEYPDEDEMEDGEDGEMEEEDAQFVSTQR